MRKFILLLIILSLTSCTEILQIDLNNLYVKKIEVIVTIGEGEIYKYYVGPKLGESTYFVIKGEVGDYQLGDKLELQKEKKE